MVHVYFWRIFIYVLIFKLEHISMSGLKYANLYVTEYISTYTVLILDLITLFYI